MLTSLIFVHPASSSNLEFGQPSGSGEEAGRDLAELIPQRDQTTSIRRPAARAPMAIRARALLAKR
jgi:hypothetical protein